MPYIVKDNNIQFSNWKWASNSPHVAKEGDNSAFAQETDTTEL